MSKKQLHIHTVPILVLSIGLFLIGTTIVFVLNTSSTSPNFSIAMASSALTSEAVSVKHYKNGLATLSSKTTTPSQQPAVPTPVIKGASTLASNTARSLQTQQLVSGLSSE
jgi:flagellar basal body-associated protein FliL